jgi:hypothetical protein
MLCEYGRWYWIAFVHYAIAEWCWSQVRFIVSYIVFPSLLPLPSNGQEGQQKEGGRQEAGEESGKEMMCVASRTSPAGHPTALALGLYGGVF